MKKMGVFAMTDRVIRKLPSNFTTKRAYKPGLFDLNYWSIFIMQVVCGSHLFWRFPDNVYLREKLVSQKYKLSASLNATSLNPN